MIVTMGATSVAEIAAAATSPKNNGESRLLPSLRGLPRTIGLDVSLLPAMIVFMML
jgi:hypothetical protein